ncbi:MAG: iron chaperone [Solirubrobacteraceae bacterium]
MDQEVVDYIATIPPEHRALFDRVHGLILEACPGVEVALSYKMPTYRAGTRRLHMAAWKHGVSIYGWKAQGDGGFTGRHPELRASTGTIRLRTDRAATIADEEIRELARATLMR